MPEIQLDAEFALAVGPDAILDCFNAGGEVYVTEEIPRDFITGDPPYYLRGYVSTQVTHILDDRKVSAAERYYAAQRIILDSEVDSKCTCASGLYLPFASSLKQFQVMGATNSKDMHSGTTLVSIVSDRWENFFHVDFRLGENYRWYHAVWPEDA